MSVEKIEALNDPFKPLTWYIEHLASLRANGDQYGFEPRLLEVIQTQVSSEGNPEFRLYSQRHYGFDFSIQDLLWKAVIGYCVSHPTPRLRFPLKNRGSVPIFGQIPCRR